MLNYYQKSNIFSVWLKKPEKWAFFVDQAGH